MRALCRLTAEPLDLEALSCAVAGDADGAVATFAGMVRDHHRGRPVARLEYHAYPEMAAEELERIAAELGRRHPVSAVALAHRTGTLEIGEVSVAIAVAAPHRGAALACCAAAIEEIKRRLPVWKREHYADGGAPEWVFAPDEAGACGAAEIGEKGGPGRA